jgi:T-complex protein 1 subunit epsilon
MSMVFDEYGRPFIIVREQNAQEKQSGNAAHKVCCRFVVVSSRRCQAHIMAARAVCSIMRTSLGPKGMDKVASSYESADLSPLCQVCQGPDGDILITNDGATIMDQMELDNQIAKLLVQLSKSQVRVVLTTA